MAMNIEDLNRQTVEIIVVVSLYSLVYVFFIGPSIGTVTGFDTPAFTSSTYVPTITLSVRTLLFVVSVLVVFYGYIHIKPRVVGDDPHEYWDM